ncbi:MAG TPA: hypothetical protein PKB15_04210 [Acidimicrobiia bacterium]|nr:hypothetical protein [Acidimicrobiia bacterium]
MHHPRRNINQRAQDTLYASQYVNRKISFEEMLRRMGIRRHWDNDRPDDPRKGRNGKLSVNHGYHQEWIHRVNVGKPVATWGPNFRSQDIGECYLPEELVDRLFRVNNPELDEFLLKFDLIPRYSSGNTRVDFLRRLWEGKKPTEWKSQPSWDPSAAAEILDIEGLSDPENLAEFEEFLDQAGYDLREPCRGGRSGQRTLLDRIEAEVGDPDLTERLSTCVNAPVAQVASPSYGRIGIGGGDGYYLGGHLAGTDLA